ncbi:putative conserved exported protein precursor [Nitrincola lacisaponensis]|uniref:Putative conserved exported protein n=1 Tax=Nitrincola lacisaponensis TaxID=267850 RepID=A0A063Y7L8_9GAMM|nr:UPF0149 family protein [Nitrincola lacisaponensis]KDE41110.1 putative conserved exported protein precursor [Nitrincola lacisaponensis]
MSVEKTLPELPGFDAVADLMISEGVLTLSPAELHGLMTGQLSAGARFDSDTLLRVLCELMNVGHLEQEGSQLALLELYQVTLSQLQDEELGFRLLLPDDDQAISQRVDALSSWCSGFLAGFGMYLGDHSMSDTLREGLQDFSEIAQVSSDPAELNDDDEAGLLELQEYVRMAALYMFAECNPGSEPDPEAMRKRLH